MASFSMNTDSGVTEGSAVGEKEQVIFNESPTH